TSSPVGGLAIGQAADSAESFFVNVPVRAAETDDAEDASIPDDTTLAELPTAGTVIVDDALPFLGTRYRWGGTTPAGFDCSGFVYFVLGESGHPVPRDHVGQLHSGERVSRGELEPGDVVFFVNTYMPGISHGGIYVGDGRFIHAGDERSGVLISSLNDPYWSAHWYGATRVA